VAPDITEGFARVLWKRGRHLTMLTFTHASDGFNFVVKPGEEVLINFSGDLRLANNAQVLSLRHEIDLPGDGEFSLTAAWLRDRNDFDVTGAVDLATAALRHDLLMRTDLDWVFSPQNRSRFGLQYAWRETNITGTVTDSRGVAPWAREPIVDAHRGSLDIRPALRRHLLSAYVEHTWRPVEALVLDGGGRVEFETSSQQWSGSARLAAASTLPSLTVLKLSGGFVAQPVRNALALDPTWGNPGLRPERTVSLIGAVEQPLPFEALLRLEVWSKWMSELVVNPDSVAGVAQRAEAGLPNWVNGGSGLAYGVDGSVVGRTRHFWWSVSAGALKAERTNPLATGRMTYPVQWEQPLTVGASTSWSPNARWLVTARVNFRLGRPYTPVDGFVLTPDRNAWIPQFGATSSERYPFFFELNLRGEHRFQWGPLSCALYAEILNVTNTMNVYSWVYGPGDVATGMPPRQGRFTHLPIRPFLGFRAEY
jgi:hypothetical protein